METAQTLKAYEKARREVWRLKADRSDHQRFRYFLPTGLGEDFIKVVGSGDYFVVLLAAANGIGKTTLAINILAHFLYKSDNQFFKHPLFKNFPYPKRARIVSDPTTVEKTIVPELHNYFPKGRYATSKNRKPYEASWTTDTGWEFDIMTYEQDTKEFESSTLGLVWFDEPPPQSIFKATIARMRKGGIIFITATPLKGSAWLYDALIANPEDDVKKMGYTTYLEADVETACIEHGIRGFLKHAHIEQMISQYDEDDLQARVKGKFQHLIGLIYKMFSRRIHIIKPFPITQEDFVVAHALDPHPRNPDAVLWLAKDRKNRNFVIDELYLKGTVSELATRIINKDTNYRMVRRICDPIAFVEDQHEETGLTLAQKLEKHGLEYIKATKDRVGADRAIADALSFRKVGEEMLKAPALYIFDNNKRLIFELEHYRWQEWTGRAADDKMSKETPVDKDDHEIENLGRLLLQDYKFTPYVRTARRRAKYISRNPYETSG